MQIVSLYGTGERFTLYRKDQHSDKITDHVLIREAEGEAAAVHSTGEIAMMVFFERLLLRLAQDEKEYLSYLTVATLPPSSDWIYSSAAELLRPFLAGNGP